MKTNQVHINFNMHVLINFNFGCGVVQFNAKHVNEIKIIYEVPMIRKLGLGNNFIRKLLCV